MNILDQSFDVTPDSLWDIVRPFVMTFYINGEKVKARRNFSGMFQVDYSGGIIGIVEIAEHKQTSHVTIDVTESAGDVAEVMYKLRAHILDKLVQSGVNSCTVQDGVKL